MKYFLGICFALVLAACKKEDVQPAPESASYEVDIRIENQSGSTFESVFVNTSGGAYNYGNILPGDTTNYYHFDFAYNYAYIELIANNDTLIIQPIDFVGEEKLSEGLYTYRLNLIDMGLNNDSVLVMNTVKD